MVNQLNHGVIFHVLVSLAKLLHMLDENAYLKLVAISWFVSRSRNEAIFNNALVFPRNVVCGANKFSTASLEAAPAKPLDSTPISLLWISWVPLSS